MGVVDVAEMETDDEMTDTAIGADDNAMYGRPITRAEALDIARRALERAACADFPDYFIGPAVLNAPLSDSSIAWTETCYPYYQEG
jgi:hypothetical protein